MAGIELPASKRLPAVREGPVTLPAGILLLRQVRAGDGDDADEFLQSCIVAWVSGV